MIAASKRERSGWHMLNVINGELTWASVLEGVRKDMRASPTWRPKLIIVHHQEATVAFTNATLEKAVLRPLECLLRSRGCRMVRTTVIRDAAARASSAAFYNRIAHSQYSAWIGEHATNGMVAFVLHNHMRLRRHNRTVPMTAADLRLAQEALSGFDAVGRTEDLGTFLAHVGVLLGWHVNVSSKSSPTPTSTRASATGGWADAMVRIANPTPLEHKYALTEQEREWTKNRTSLDARLANALCLHFRSRASDSSASSAVPHAYCPLKALRPPSDNRDSACSSTAGTDRSVKL